MSRDRIMTLAREGRGFILGRNTQESTVKLVAGLLREGKLRIAEQFKPGDGCRVVSCV